MSQNIKIGDVVRLKSSSQDMTVTKVNEECAELIWAHDSEIKKKSDIPLDALVKTSMYYDLVDLCKRFDADYANPTIDEKGLVQAFISRMNEIIYS